MLCSIVAAFALLAHQASPFQPVPMGMDQRGRPTIEVTVNGQGPFDFVVDTAAQLHVVMPRLVERLSLDADTAGVQVQGASGRSAARMHTLESIASGAFCQESVMAVALPNASVIEAWGIVGMRGFSGQRVLFDNEASTFAVTPSGALAGDMVALPATLFSTFAIITVTIDGHPVKAVIDSGARRSVANDKALEVLGWADGDPRLSAGEPIGGATSDETPARVGRVGNLTLGPIVFEDATVTFSELSVFGALGLADEPAIILGIDVLGRLPAYAIDYPRAEFQFRRLPADGNAP